MDKQITTVTIQVDKDFHRRLKHFLIDEGKTLKAVFMECMEARMVKKELEK